MDITADFHHLLILIGTINVEFGYGSFMEGSCGARAAREAYRAAP